MRRDPGKVYLVGAGPGDAELITVRGLRLLRLADVVVYDRLASTELLDEIRPGAERLYVGKTPGRHTCPQDEINDLLVDRARRGLTVVRLKGGDPFVFGRGGEEGLALAGAGIPFEVVPGVTSAVSVPAYAGIPVTHRGVATAFTVVTGHTCDAGAEGLDWEALSRAGTLVILMGLTNLPQITAALLAAGRDPETPVAVVARGTTEGQVVAEGTLVTITAEAAHLAAPATIVVGEVVRLRTRLDWFDPDAAAQPPSGDAAPVRHAVPFLAAPGHYIPA